jgi:uncharacterized Zn finger protein (UPF0148 family)
MKECPRCGPFKDKKGTGICPTCGLRRHDKTGTRTGRAAAAKKAAKGSPALMTEEKK